MGDSLRHGCGPGFQNDVRGRPIQCLRDEAQAQGVEHAPCRVQWQRPERPPTRNPLWFSPWSGRRASSHRKGSRPACCRRAARWRVSSCGSARNLQIAHAARRIPSRLFGSGGLTVANGSKSREGGRSDDRPNLLVLCMDQWDTHMELPEGVELPALERLESRGVTYDRAYCAVPICTPSRASMWTGVHAKETGLWDNTNFAWIGELSPEIPTVGHMLREQGYYTAFKGKWHVSAVPRGEDALERYGFSDYQQWGEMFGAPLQGAMLDGAAAFETVDWLENAATRLEQPWLLVCCLVNPHDVMFLQTDPIEAPEPNGAMAGLQTTVQRLGWFQKRWPVSLPANFADDYALQPYGVRHYKESTDRNYGRVPDDRTDLWLERRNYLVNAMRLVDAEF